MRHPPRRQTRPCETGKGSSPRSTGRHTHSGGASVRSRAVYNRTLMIPIEHQPAGYWATNLYTSPHKRPKMDAPLRDLPTRAARRFKRARGNPRVETRDRAGGVHGHHLEMGVDVRSGRAETRLPAPHGDGSLRHVHPDRERGARALGHGRPATRVTSGDARRTARGRRAVVLDGVPGPGRGRRVRECHHAEASVTGAARVSRGACAPFDGSATFWRPQAVPHTTIHSPSSSL